MLRSQKKTEEYKNILADEFNVAWKVIKGSDYLLSDKELSELCMTITGTIVAYKEGETRRVITYPSKADNDDLIKALFEGGNVWGYSCAETGKCLKIQAKEYKIGSGGFASKVRKTLSVITKKAIDDAPLSPAEIAFIGRVRLPIYKMVNVLTTHKRAEFDLKDFADIVCVDLIHQYISEILDVILEETVNLKNAQVSDEQVNEFIAQLQKAKTRIDRKRKIAYEQMNQMLIMIETTKIYEKKVENTFEVLQKNWEKHN